MLWNTFLSSISVNEGVVVTSHKLNYHLLSGQKVNNRGSIFVFFIDILLETGYDIQLSRENQPKTSPILFQDI